MSKSACWTIIIISIIVNVIMLNRTVEAFYGREPEILLVYSGISLVSSFIALLTYFQWRKVEY